MTESMGMNCPELAEVAAELALGVLTGRERAEAVAHLDHCDSCREHVRQLMEAGEGLVGLLPEREPPAGFETRVLDRLGLEGPGSGSAGAGSPGFGSPGFGSTAPRPVVRGSRRAARGPGPSRRLSPPRRALAAAAVVVAVIFAGMGGWGMGVATSSHSSQQGQLTSAAFFTGSHRTVGEVFVYWGSPRWLYMSVDLPSGDGMVTCQLMRAGGKITTVGSFQLADGYGSWASPDPGSLGTVRGARLVTPGGMILATATFG
jgi:hypothetical protein